MFVVSFIKPLVVDEVAVEVFMANGVRLKGAITSFQCDDDGFVRCLILESEEKPRNIVNCAHIMTIVPAV